MTLGPVVVMIVR